MTRPCRGSRGPAFWAGCLLGAALGTAAEAADDIRAVCSDSDLAGCRAAAAVSAEAEAQSAQEGLALLQYRQREHGGTASASSSDEEEMLGDDVVPLVQDVESAFNSIDFGWGHTLEIKTGSLFPKGYDQGHMPYSEHFQGVQRKQNGHQFYIAGSGESMHTGQVFVLDMPSRPSSGPLGSNMIDWQSGKELKKPPSSDVLAKVVEVDKEYWHAGGLSSYGNILVVGAEAGCSVSERLMGGCKDASRVHFYDTSDPLSPRELPYVIDRPTATAGASTLVRARDGGFLLAVGRVDSAIIDFYSTSAQSLDTDPGWQLVQTWSKEALQAVPGQKAEFGEYQNLNFIRQTDGTLFMVGFYRTMKGVGDDTADLYAVDDRYTGKMGIVKIASQKMKCPSGTCNLMAGGGVYVSDETNLVIYTTNWEPKDGYFYVNEFRSKYTGVGGGCERMTVGTCSWMGCASSRGPTDCVANICVCKPGYCRNNGKCIPGS